MTRETVRPLLTLVAVCASAACGSAITQHSKSGEDFEVKGAKTIKLDDGYGRSKDNVTYPGGDRVDWKTFETPSKGDISITLKWTSPRPDLDLSMNILDDTYTVVKRVPPASSGSGRKTAELKDMPAGNYYVQVYASGRGDAGEYTLEVQHSPERAVMPQNVEALPNPPRLPAIPAAVAAAAGGGGGGGGGVGPKGSETNPCKPGEQCPPGALFINPACPTAPPAMPGTPCPPAAAIKPECPEAGPLMPEQPCPPKPRAGRIIERSRDNQDIIITIDKGSNHGIGKGWMGVIFTGRSGSKVLTGSDFTIFKVTEDESYGKIRKLSLDDLGENTRVELRAPPAP
jgi:hypothetical protein